jgi:hypothetical protein
MNTTMRKIVALGVGATMLAGTAAMALAYDLSSYPEPFVKNGVFTGKLVIGEKASVVDVLGATDIAAALQRDAGVKVTAAAGATTVAGGVALDLTSDRINLGQGIKKTSLTNTDFPDLLQGMDFTNDAGTTYPYTQEIDLNTATTGGKLDFAKYSSNNDPALGFQLGTTSANYLYKAKVTFSTVVNLTDSNSKGQVITLFGKDYTIGSETTRTKLYLYGSSTEATLERGKDTTVKSNGVDYDVKVIGFSKGSDNKDQVIVSVNGATGTITQGSSKKIPSTDGIQIFAKTVSSWNNQAEGIATLQLGSNKLLLQSGTTVKTGDSEDKIKGTEVAYTGTWDNLNDFSVYVFGTGSNEEEDYLLAGNALVDPVFGTFKVDFPTVANDLNAAKDVVKLSRGGDDRAVVDMVDKNGKTASFTFARNSASGIGLIDDSSPARAISVIEGAMLTLNDFVMLPANDPSYGHLVQVSSLDLTNDTNGDDQIELTDVFSGDHYKSTKYNYNDVTSKTTTVNIDGKSYTLTSDNTTSVKITLTSGDSGVQVYPAMKLQGGEELALMGPITGLSLTGNSTTLVLPSDTTGVTTAVTVGSWDTTKTVGGVTYTLTWSGTTLTGIRVGTTPAIFIREEQDEQTTKNNVYIATTDANSSGTYYLGFSAPTISGAKVGPISYEDSSVTSYLDLYGTFIKKTSVSGSNGEVRYEIDYPAAQMFANVFVSPVAATASTAASTGAVQLNPISVGMAILDSQATLGSTPYIVVGGPCANTVAAALLGNPADCTAGFSEGKAKIKLFADKNALLVAGGLATDTQAGSRVLSLYSSTKYASKFTGTELEVVTQTGSTDPTVNNVQ